MTQRFDVAARSIKESEVDLTETDVLKEELSRILRHMQSPHL